MATQFRQQFRQPLVGQRLLGLRKRLKLSRAELSRLTGVTTSAIVRLESGHDVRLSSYFPIIDFMLVHERRGWMVAERFVLLTPAEREAMLESLGVVDEQTRE